MSETGVVVVGLGRIGLPTAVLLARAGEHVVGVDVDPAVRERVSSGDGGHEPGLGPALREALAAGRLRVSARVEPAPVVVVCVPTEALDAATAEIGAVVPPGATVIVESTVPVGTTDAVAERLRARQPDVHVAYCPERVLPGDALHEIVTNDRVVGGVDSASAEAAENVLRRFVSGRIDRTDARTAELVKLVENASRDVGLALAHTVRALATRFGVDAVEVRALANRHPRVALLEPGIGVGGHCLPVDPLFLVAASPADAALLRTAREVNDAVPAQVVAQLLREIPADASVALLGLAYKPDVDDLRNAPAVQIARALAAERDVVVCDPVIGDVSVEGLRLVTLEQALERNVVVLLVAHGVFASIAHRLRPSQTLLDPTGTWR